MISFNTAKIVYLNPKQGTKMSYHALRDMLAQITEKAENFISDTVRYNPISVSIKHNNKDYKAVALNISQDEDKFNGHMLEISVLDNTFREHKRPLVYGDKNTLLQYLKRYDTAFKAQQDLKAVLDEIKT